LVAVAALLRAMADAQGGRVLGYIALGAGIFWIIDAICLLTVQAVNSLSEADEDEPKIP
jgi:hypothetical protein